jgi:DNA processing protein
MAGNFPRRNRLISGLARAVLVVQAADESGSLITARLAGQQGRDVFAIPGSIHSPLSKGCHRLIREGAKLVDDVDHVLEELGFAPARLKRAAASPHPMLGAMGFDPLTIDEIIGRTGQAASSIAAQLSELEIDGRVQALPGGRFQQVGRMNLVPSD